MKNIIVDLSDKNIIICEVNKMLNKKKKGLWMCILEIWSR